MKKRDAAYYQRRLKAEHPSIYADLRAGRIASTRQAAAKAELIRLPTRLTALKREWKRAKGKERREFLEWLRTEVASGTNGTSPQESLLDSTGHLKLSAADRVWRQMRSLQLKKSEMYVQMGLKAYDWRVIGVLQRERKPTPQILEAISAWLAANAF